MRLRPGSIPHHGSADTLLPCPACPQILANLQQQVDAMDALSLGPWSEQQHAAAVAGFKACVQVRAGGSSSSRPAHMACLGVYHLVQQATGRALDPCYL